MLVWVVQKKTGASFLYIVDIIRVAKQKYQCSEDSSKHSCQPGMKIITAPHLFLVHQLSTVGKTTQFTLAIQH